MKISFMPPPGINSDDTTFAAEGRWADCNNVRFRMGKPETIGGYYAPGATATADITSMYVASATSIVLGCKGVLNAGSVTSVSDVSPVGLGANEGSQGWTFGTFGTSVMCCPTFGTIYEYTGSGVATAVTNAPADVVAMLVTPQRQILAFGCNEEISGTFNQRCIRGCDIEDSTDWTTAATNNAFEDILDDTGVINGADLVGDYIAVWTNTSLFMGTFLGDPSQTYRWERIDGAPGLLSLRAKVVVEGRAYWVTENGVWMTWAPGSPVTSVPCPIGFEFRNYLSELRAGAFFNEPFREIWLLYDDTRDAGTDCSRYIAFNIDDGTWFKGILARSAGASNPNSTSGADALPRTNVLMTGSGSDRNVYYHEYSFTNVPAWHITSADQYIDEGQKRVEINEIWPDFETQSASVTLTITTRDFPQSATTTTDTYTLAAGNEYTSLFSAGRLASVKFSSASTGCFMRLGKPVFDIQTIHDR